MNIDTNRFKEKLTDELAIIEAELPTVGRRDPANPEQWEAVEPDVDRDRADETEVADGIEQYENNTVILKQLKTRMDEVNAALLKIENGGFGVCEVGGEEIEEDRLEANPAAKTCKAHMN